MFFIEIGQSPLRQGIIGIRLNAKRSQSNDHVPDHGLGQVDTAEAVVVIVIKGNGGAHQLGNIDTSEKMKCCFLLLFISLYPN